MAFLAAIGDLGPRAAESVPAVRALLRDGSPEIRGRAIEVLFQSAPRDDRMLDDLSALLDDPDPRVQRRAIDAIRALGPPGRKALPVVIGRLDSPDPDVRLAGRPDGGEPRPGRGRGHPGAGHAAGRPDPEGPDDRRDDAGRFGKAAQPAFAPLAMLLGDEDVAVREAAASAIGQPGTRRRDGPAPPRQGPPGREGRGPPRGREGHPAARPAGASSSSPTSS